MQVFETLQAEDPRHVGPYRIVARLGAGGMGRIYLGRSKSGRAVAIKVIRPELCDDRQFLERFAREVALARAVSGFFTAAVVDADPQGSPPWLATAYVPGLSLHDAIAEHGPWKEMSVLALGAGLAEALGSIHAAGVVHRDLKPSNVLLAADGPRVIDFGISFAMEGSRLTDTGMAVGTPGFMSPEQLTGDPVGPASDIFCLGVVLAFTATGAGPFGTGSWQRQWYRTVHEEPNLETLPPRLRSVVARCLAKQPGQRPTAATLLDELAEHVTDETAVTALFADTTWLPETVAQAVRTRTATPLPVSPPPVTPPAVHATPGTASDSQPTPITAEASHPTLHVSAANRRPGPQPVPTDQPAPALTGDDSHRRPTAAKGVRRRRTLLGLAVLGAAAGFTGWQLYGTGPRANEPDASPNRSVLVGGPNASAGQGNAMVSTATSGKIGVILPHDAVARWESTDRKYLEAAFKDVGVQYDIQNAQGDKAAFQTIADQMISSGVTVLIVVSPDGETGKAVLDKAKAQGVVTIDHDRLTFGGNADYYVGFDQTAVGRLQGEGLVRCLTGKGVDKPVVAELNGSPTDDNAARFKEGYDSVLRPKYDSGEYVKGPDQSVPEWNDVKAQRIFEQMLARESKIAGVLAANDGLANATITVLRSQKLNGTVPVTGQDASVQGLQNILSGDQCMTVYKAPKLEADATAQLAIALVRGQKPTATGTVKDPETGKNIPAVLLTPAGIFKNDVKDVVADGSPTKEELCVGEFADKCAEAGVS
ncbi:bifunctional serine/threonine-protein kinase/ABC transporter substrate-binding protein [Streptosporangium sp. NPDC051023]|uniref:bifunctional serine/threonine-protein kinase/ABC transporter substrate-binding protein n=1 Tax=Streptosporangium sp. NPDC051023 TaxID=3155410 RepID=UPI00344B6810